MRASSERLKEYLDIIAEAAAGAAKVVLTLRAPEELDAEGPSQALLWETLHGLSGVRRMRISPFSGEQVHEYLRKCFGETAELKARHAFLADQQLLHRPDTPMILS